MNKKVCWGILYLGGLLSVLPRYNLANEVPSPSTGGSVDRLFFTPAQRQKLLHLPSSPAVPASAQTGEAVPPLMPLVGAFPSLPPPLPKRSHGWIQQSGEAKRFHWMQRENASSVLEGHWKPNLPSPSGEDAPLSLQPTEWRTGEEAY